MLQIMLSALIACFAVVGCSGPRYADYFPYHDDGTAKPRVTLMPVINSCNCDLPWDLSEEFTESLYYELMNSGQLYVLSPQEIGQVWAKSGQIDFFGMDMGFAREFCNADFIVALELIEHSASPCSSDACKQGSDFHPCNRNLCIQMRVRVIDVRGQMPRIALYEIAKTNYSFTSVYDNIDYEKCGWGCERYEKTPCAIAHQRMIQKLTNRLEESIWSAK